MKSVRVSVAIAALLLGCHTQGGGSGPYQVRGAGERNPLEAQRLTQLALDLVETNPEQAEALLRKALTEDLWHGPAHNNLGVVFLAQGKLYEAANEFEWARKLLPGDPDPRMNLALTLERACRYDEALLDYRDSLEQSPHHMPTKQALVRLQRFLGQKDGATRGLLREVALAGEDELWRAWAQDQLVRLDER